jgi:hypothetical protein
VRLRLPFRRNEVHEAKADLDQAAKALEAAKMHKAKAEKYKAEATEQGAQLREHRERNGFAELYRAALRGEPENGSGH